MYLYITLYLWLSSKPGKKSKQGKNIKFKVSYSLVFFFPRNLFYFLAKEYGFYATWKKWIHIKEKGIIYYKHTYLCMHACELQKKKKGITQYCQNPWRELIRTNQMHDSILRIYMICGKGMKSLTQGNQAPVSSGRREESSLALFFCKDR